MPMGIYERRPKPVGARFWPKVNKDGPIPGTRPDLGKCWLWKGAKIPTGYGSFRVNKILVVKTHRYTFVRVHGPIAEGLTIDHLCRNRSCVNPAHLEVVTQKENTARGFTASSLNARKTHCLNGHNLCGDNLVIQKGKYGPMRVCRICAIKRKREWYIAHKLLPEPRR
jgi:hypothetical protein